jgi:hypothetical protein
MEVLTCRSEKLASLGVLISESGTYSITVFPFGISIVFGLTPS